LAKRANAALGGGAKKGEFRDPKARLPRRKMKNRKIKEELTEMVYNIKTSNKAICREERSFSGRRRRRRDIARN
jgi:hypothetical protein